jgi:putative NIF3 family GTP cyclohydrolase 1 type 2
VRETVDELRIEIICPGERLGAVLAAIRARHSYEEPAIDVYPLHSSAAKSGSGRIGRLLEPRTLEQFAAHVSRSLGQAAVQIVGDPRKPILHVAIACGAGDDFLADAARAKADVLLTGEARFQTFDPPACRACRSEEQA